MVVVAAPMPETPVKEIVDIETHLLAVVHEQETLEEAVVFGLAMPN